MVEVAIHAIQCFLFDIKISSTCSYMTHGWDPQIPDPAYQFTMQLNVK